MSWWCHPETAPGSVTTWPAHRTSPSNALARAMPGVGSAGWRSSGLITETGSTTLGVCHHTAVVSLTRPPLPDDLTFLSPLSEDRAAGLVEFLATGLSDGGSVLDIG